MLKNDHSCLKSVKNNKKTHRTLRMHISAMFITVCVVATAAAPGCIEEVFAARSNSGSDIASYEGKWVKVGLKYSSTAVNSATISAEGGLLIGEASDDGIEELLPLPAYDTVEVIYEDSGFTVTAEDGTLLSADIGADGVILPLDYEDGTVLKYGSGRYRGGIMFSENSGESFNVINYLPLEHYLYGVINAEMDHGYPLEALKAQAVTARSYVICNEGRHGSSGFDVCATTHCQVYRGYDGEYKETTLAADETFGEVMYYGSRVVPGYYSKNSGGHTENSEDVWGSKEGYLRGVEDEYSPDYPWSATYSFAEIEKKLTNAGYGVGELESIAVLSRNASGSVAEIAFRGTDGTQKFTCTSFRSLFGASTIKSGMFTVDNEKITYTGKVDGGDKANGKPSSSNNQRAASEGFALRDKQGNTATGSLNGFYAVGSEGKAQKLSSETLYVLSTEGLQKISNKSTSEGNSSGNTQSVDFSGTEVITEDPVYFNGLGYGHGVGMPQDSAIEMAKQGFDYLSILDYYYTGIEIEQY